MNTQLVPIEENHILPPHLWTHSREFSHLCVSLQIYFIFWGGGNTDKTSLINNITFLLELSMNSSPPTENCCSAQSQLRDFHFMTGPDKTLGPDAGALLRLRSADWKHIEQVWLKIKGRTHLSSNAPSLLSSQWLTTCRWTFIFHCALFRPVGAEMILNSKSRSCFLKLWIQV